MNNKLISYEEAKIKLKDLESIQRIYKGYRKHKGEASRSAGQKMASSNKHEINMILNIIYLHKQSRKLWAEKERYKNEK